MAKKRIDVSEIKTNDIDETSTFTDLMTKKQRRTRHINDDIEDMVNEKKKTTADLTEELQKAKKEYNENINEEKQSKTQILELTRQMKFNFEENKAENVERKKRGVSPLNIIGEVNLLCIGYYIYLLVFTNYQDEQSNYLITGGIIMSLVLLFGLSVVTKKGVSNFFRVLNILTIFGFVFFNAYTLMQ